MTVQINYWMTPDDFLNAEKRAALIQAAIDVDSTIPGSGGTTLEIICDHSTLETVFPKLEDADVELPPL